MVDVVVGSLVEFSKTDKKNAKTQGPLSENAICINRRSNSYYSGEI